ncbi:CoA pyrophosphatase [Crocinitomicaceae bacterium]|nr:CoA pyrophosphatase [Crocinitomicaceae bacterium]
MKALKSKIVLGLQETLPGEIAHAEMAPVNRPLSSLAIQKAENIRESAVSIILSIINNDLRAILIQRPIYEGVHSGQIAFPGGKKDLTDPHLEYTARRESFEEVGIPMHQGELIGELTEVYIPVSNFLVKPFVYFHDTLPLLVPQEREVAEIITFSITDLLNPNTVGQMEVKFPNGIIQKNIPCFHIENKRVWGATALILNELRYIIK